MVKQKSWDYACNKLQRAYDLALSNTDDFSFYINLVNYVALFDEIPELKELIEPYFIKAAKKHNSLLSKYEEEIIRQTLVIFEKVSPYIKKNKIKNPEILDYIDKIGKINDEKIYTSDGKMKSMFGNLNRVLYVLWETDNDKHQDFLKQFGKIEENGIKWNISKKVDEYDVEEIKMKRIGLVKIWYYWDKIAFFHNLFMEREKMVQHWFEQKRFMTLMGINEAYKELAKPLGLLDRHEKITSPYFFPKNDMQNALRQFHYHLLDLIDSLKSDKENKIKATYNHKRRELTIKGKVIPFQEGKRADLLSLLFKQQGRVYFDEELNHLQGIDTAACSPDEIRTYKKKFINYAVGINSRIAEEGFTDFLFAESNSVSINPLYF